MNCVSIFMQHRQEFSGQPNILYNLIFAIKYIFPTTISKSISFFSDMAVRKIINCAHISKHESGQLHHR